MWARPLLSPAELFADLERRRKPRDARAKRIVRHLARADLAIARADLAIARAIVDKGRCLRELLSERLYANLGYRSFVAALEALGISRSQAFKLMALAERSNAERVASLGVEGAYREIARRKRARSRRADR
jgi:hypothetical protein